MSSILLGPPLFPAVYFLIECLRWRGAFARCQWRMLAWYYGILVILAPASWWFSVILEPPLSVRWIGAACLLVLWACGFVMTGALYIRRRDEEAAELEHLCRKCKYDLTGNTSGVCPECGQAIPASQQALLIWYCPGKNAQN